MIARNGILLLLIGGIMVLTGIGLFTLWFIRHWKRRKRDIQPNYGVAEFFAANAFFHFGMLLLTMGGVSLIYLSFG